MELREGAKGAFTTSLPKFLESGGAARLIPVIADGRREQWVVSVFLATLSAVPGFAQLLLSSVGVRLGKRSLIDTDTEVVVTVPEDTKDRLDGLIVVFADNESWKALIEAKFESSDLDEEQVHRYLQLARESGVTLSTRFAARPDHSPISPHCPDELVIWRRRAPILL